MIVIKVFKIVIRCITMPFDSLSSCSNFEILRIRLDSSGRFKTIHAMAHGIFVRDSTVSLGRRGLPPSVAVHVCSSDSWLRSTQPVVFCIDFWSTLTQHPAMAASVIIINALGSTPKTPYDELSLHR